MPSDLIQQIKAALQAATPGPWAVGDDPSQVIAPCPCCGLIATCAPYGLPTGDRDHDSQHHYNSDLIVLLRNHAEALVARVEAAEAEAQRLRLAQAFAQAVHDDTYTDLSGIPLKRYSDWLNAQPAASEQGQGE